MYRYLRYPLLWWIFLYSSCFALEEITKENLLLFFGHDDREYVGALQKSFPWAAIGLLEMQSGATCTATLIAPNTILTAAHCFWMQGKHFDFPRFFWAGKDLDSFGAKYTATVTRFSTDFAQGLRYEGEDVYIEKRVAHQDWAIVKVNLRNGHAPIPFPLFRGNARTLKAVLEKSNWQVSQAGYAEDQEDVLTSHKVCRISHLHENLTVLHQCDTLPGDSGSPIWIDVKGKPQLIAIQSSAPDVKDRDRADNVAVSVLVLRHFLPHRYIVGDS